MNISQFTINGLSHAEFPAANDCIPRYFGDESIVCVCNSTYCDSTPETNLESGSFLWYASSKSGSRMKLTIGKMGNMTNSSRTITINHKTKYQKVYGFGGAFTDATGINTRDLSEATQENLLKLGFCYFGLFFTGFKFKNRSASPLRRKISNV